MLQTHSMSTPIVKDLSRFFKEFLDLIFVLGSDRTGTYGTRIVQRTYSVGTDGDVTTGKVTLSIICARGARYQALSPLRYQRT